MEREFGREEGEREEGGKEEGVKRVPQGWISAALKSRACAPPASSREQPDTFLARP
jgi:hypothetical protein